MDLADDQERRIDQAGVVADAALPVGIPLAALAVAGDVAIDALVHGVAQLGQGGADLRREMTEPGDLVVRR